MDSVAKAAIPFQAISSTRNRNWNWNGRSRLIPVNRSIKNWKGKAIAGNNQSIKNWEGKARAADKVAWDVNDSAQLYGIKGWGGPYFCINPQGNVCVRPLATSDGSDEVEIVELIDSLQRQNVKLPMVIRFTDILLHRMQQLQECFDIAIAKYSYQQSFQGVFPIKCNHDCFLIDEIVEFGCQFKFGLEAGSKPELLIAISKLCQNKDALLICNGYKDRIYVESALLARQLGLNVVLVLEQSEELDLVIKISKILGVQPTLGVRAKLSTKYNGHWAGTSGDSGKFGLSVNKLIQVVYRLREENMLHCLQLLHFHIGSQVPSISIIKEAMREASHIYCELALMGAPMCYIDVGGGLGIDYDGTKTPSNASTDYTMQNYANDVVAALQDACILKGIPEPVIVSESGRALASHHSVLVFDVLSVSQRTESESISNLESLARRRVQSSTVVQKVDHAGEFNPGSFMLNCSNGNVRGVQNLGEHFPGSIMSNRASDTVKRDHDPGEYLLSAFSEVYRALSPQSFEEVYNDANQFKMEAQSLFKLGCLSLEQRAEVEAMYDAVLYRAEEYCRGSELPGDFKKLTKSLAATYHVNLSIFRSAPDSWAIDQVFPIMPLHRLDEEPKIRATLADLTCDSDGKFDKFIHPSGQVEGVLSVHNLCEGKPYYIGLFLAGAYQEIMGSAHNLFGRTNVVYVRCKPLKNEADNKNTNQRGHYSLERVVEGEAMKEVLHTVQHIGSSMIEDIQREIESAIGRGQLSTEEAETLLMNFKCSLDSYTYLTN